MYTYTPNMRFLVLSPVNSAPEQTKEEKVDDTHKFLSLSPVHNGPEPDYDYEDSIGQSMVTYTPTHAFLTLSPVHSGRRPQRSRSSSVSSTASDASRTSGISFTPDGGRFLYLGY